MPVAPSHGPQSHSDGPSYISLSLYFYNLLHEIYEAASEILNDSTAHMASRAAGDENHAALEDVRAEGRLGRTGLVHAHRSWGAGGSFWLHCCRASADSIQLNLLQ